MAPTSKDHFKLHLIILIFAFTAILGKLITIPTLGVVFYRTLIATATIFIIAKLKKKAIKISNNKLIQYLIIGSILGIHWLCFFGSARLSTISLSLVCFSTTSFFTSLLEPLFFKQKVKTHELILGTLAVFGTVIIFNFESQYYLGIIVAIVGAILASLFTILNSKYCQEDSGLTINFYELGAACFITGLIALIIEPQVFILPSSSNLGYLLILAIACTVYPYIEMINLLKVFSPFTITLNVNLEPIYGIILAFLFFGEAEKMTAGFYIGGSLIMVGIIIQSLMNKKSPSTLN